MCFGSHMGGMACCPRHGMPLLFSQLQEGLSHNLMEAPAVSGAANYSALCIAAKNEEQRQAALRSRQAYREPQSSVPLTSEDKPVWKQTAPKARSQESETDTHKCCMCGKLRHIAHNCRNQQRSESSGQKISKPGCNNQTATTRLVPARYELRGNMRSDNAAAVMTLMTTCTPLRAAQMMYR